MMPDVDMPRIRELVDAAARKSAAGVLTLDEWRTIADELQSLAQGHPIVEAISRYLPEEATA